MSPSYGINSPHSIHPNGFPEYDRFWLLHFPLIIVLVASRRWQSESQKLARINSPCVARTKASPSREQLVVIDG